MRRLFTDKGALVSGAVSSVLAGLANQLIQNSVSGLPLLLSSAIIAGLLFAFWGIIYLAARRLSFPERASGIIPYNRNIRASDFRFPQITDQRKYRHELFLIGPNQNWILNEHQYRSHLISLISSLGPPRRVRMLVGDPNSPELEHMYVLASSKDFVREEKEIVSTIARLDQIIAEEFGQKRLDQIRDLQLLEIRATDTFLDSFCFVDSSTPEARGYFMLVTKKTGGGDRPIYYFTQGADPHIFNTYLEIYRNIYEDSDNLWPVP